MITPSELQDLLKDAPALAPPPGVVADFVHPATFRTEFMVVLSLSVTVVTLAVSMRTWTKYVVMRQVVREDCMIECLLVLNQII